LEKSVAWRCEPFQLRDESAIFRPAGLMEPKGIWLSRYEP
jgi:hypothetical protein